MARTLVQKIWDTHQILEMPGGKSLLYIDRVFLHERTGSLALLGLASEGRTVRNPAQAFCTMDHIVSTMPGRGDDASFAEGAPFITTTRKAAIDAGIHLFDLGDPRQGIVHVVSPEQGIAIPGVTLVCPDSHTCTLGGLGALAWGIGTTDSEHALATQTLPIRQPGQMRVTFDGPTDNGVTAKDMILYLIGAYTASGGVGYAVEFAGQAVRNLEVEARLTLCNMAVEFGAWTGIVAPDEKTFEYVQGRPFAPKSDAWTQALNAWRQLFSDEEAVFDREITIRSADIAPQVTWGTSPQHVAGVDEHIPDPDDEPDPNRRAAIAHALNYMAVEAGVPLASLQIDAAFIGSCTNSRLSDLRIAAAILDGRRVHENVRAVCVPGSSQVKAAAEAEGLHRVFERAGFQWRESGCSMCFYAGGETFGPGARVASTTNRNFENRQGPGTRTHLASPATVAASAIAGHFVDVRDLTNP